MSFKKLQWEVKIDWAIYRYKRRDGSSELVELRIRRVDEQTDQAFADRRIGDKIEPFFCNRNDLEIVDIPSQQPQRWMGMNGETPRPKEIVNTLESGGGDSPGLFVVPLAAIVIIALCRGCM